MISTFHISKDDRIITKLTSDKSLIIPYQTFITIDSLLFQEKPGLITALSITDNTQDYQQEKKIDLTANTIIYSGREDCKRDMTCIPTIKLPFWTGGCSCKSKQEKLTNKTTNQTKEKKTIKSPIITEMFI